MASLGGRGSSVYVNFHRSPVILLSTSSVLRSTIPRPSRRGFAAKGDAQKPKFVDEKEMAYKKPPPPIKTEPKPIGGNISRVAPRPRTDISTLPPSTEDPKREPRTFPRIGIAYMGGIANPNAEFGHTSFKPAKPVTIAEAKASGCRINLPVREYYADPMHWKFGKSHLLLSIEWDFMHIWVRPPDGHPFPACDYERLDVFQFRKKYPVFVPPLQRMVPYALDWVITDLHTFFAKTQGWSVPLLEKALGCKIHKHGTPEYADLAAKDELEGKPLMENKGSWVGPNYLKKLISKDKDGAGPLWTENFGAQK